MCVCVGGAVRVLGYHEGFGQTQLVHSFYIKRYRRLIHRIEVLWFLWLGLRSDTDSTSGAMEQQKHIVTEFSWSELRKLKGAQVRIALVYGDELC